MKTNLEHNKNKPLIYFAGKVEKLCYRTSFGNERIMSCGRQDYHFNGAEFTYCGPFAIGCDHGCFHSNVSLHGNTSFGCSGSFKDEYNLDIECYKLDKHNIIDRCYSQIKDCDIFYAYINADDCFGTLLEIGYAKGLKKNIYIIMSKELKKASLKTFEHTNVFHGFNDIEKDDFWFLNNDLSFNIMTHDNPLHYLPEAVLKWKLQNKPNYYFYIQSQEWKIKAEKAKEKAEYKCQICYSKENLNAHHRTYERLGNEIDGDITVLCKKCHELYEINNKLKKIKQ